MSIFDTIKRGINPDGDGAYGPEDEYTNTIDNDFNPTQTYQQGQPYQDPYAPDADNGVEVSGHSLELKVVKPERFDSVPVIAQHLLNGRTVVLNLESTDRETARRMLDFLSGVAFSIDGDLKRVANNTYVITPRSVDISADSSVHKQKKENSVDFDTDEV